MDKNARRRVRRAERELGAYMDMLKANLSPRYCSIHEHRDSCISTVSQLIRLHRLLDSAPTDETRADHLRGFKPLNRLDLRRSVNLLNSVDEMLAALPEDRRDDPRAREYCEIASNAPLEQ